MDVMRILVVIAVIAIVASLASALAQLSKQGGDPQRMLRALTWRIGLSVGLFVLLIVGWWLGLITPHGVSR